MNTSLQYLHDKKTPRHPFQGDAENTLAYLGKFLSAPAPAAALLSFHREGEESADYSCVDFSPFKRLKAKIDAITFSCFEKDLSPAAVQELRSLIKDGRLEIPRDCRDRSGSPYPWLAVHDPSLRDLKVLVERFWNSKITRIEFAIDACLPDGSNELWRLERLKAQLRHCLHPQRYQRLRKALRKHFVKSPRRYRRDGLGTALPDTQVIWENNVTSDQLALYIKTLDGAKHVGQPWVRMEARLLDSGPYRAGLGRLGMLPRFAHDLRARLAPIFWIGAGFKNVEDLRGPGIPHDPWTAWGAQWAADGKVKLHPNAEANRLVGVALNELRDSIARIPIPTAVADRYEDWCDEMS